MAQEIVPPQLPLVSSTRDSLNLTLQVKSGKVPDDMYGYVFINTPNGTVNSALPYPKNNPDGTPNQEYSSPILGGAGYIFKFDLNESGVVKLKSNLLKPHSYFADEATKYGTSLHKLVGFKNMGIARLSFVLGAAEQLGTAVIPVKFKNDKRIKLLATADLGRAYEFNPDLLMVTKPIGKLSDYVAGTPPIVPWIFKLIQGTAHPTFDPVTQELFTVNYTKSIKTLLQASGLLPMLQKNPDAIERIIEETITELEDKIKENKEIRSFDNFVTLLEKKIAKEAKETWFGKLIKKLLALFKKDTSLTDTVYLLRFTDTNTHNRWRVVDEQGKDITIWQCMHQTSLSKDYVLLIDAAFKLSLDVLMNNPFPNNEKINAFLRQLTTKPQMADTPMYIIKRADLNPNQDTVVAKKLNLKPEFIHFTANYPNDNNLITIYTASNAAACLAEWVRYYDKLFPDTPIEQGTEGILCVGSMDVGRVGKIVIDAQNATIKEEKMVFKTGNLGSSDGLGPHTWLAGFYTFRDFISAEVPTMDIKNIYWQFGALEKRRLTQFIFNLYKDYPNRIVPAEDVKKYSEQGVPLQIARLNTENMELEDYYQYPDNYTLGAIQFVPRKTPNPNLDPSMDGYLFTTMINGVEEEGDTTNYLREVWIFDASNLKQGPVCVLTHPEFNFGFTLHPLWIPDTNTGNFTTTFDESQSHEDHIAEYKTLIDKTHKKDRESIHDLFEKHIYPNLRK